MNVYYSLIFSFFGGLLLTSCGFSSGKFDTGDLDTTGEVDSTETKILVEYESSAKQAVDLGLSVKWAACNLGATKPELYGDYYAWGETKPKAKYTEDNGCWHNVGYAALKSKGVIDDRGNLTAKYDAATSNWGAGWRMPTHDEIKELLNRCRWNWVTMNGVEGYKVTGPSGKSIFLPAAGYRYGAGADFVGNNGCFFGATALNECAVSFNFDSDCYDWHSGFRSYGRSVRPVTK